MGYIEYIVEREYAEEASMHSKSLPTRWVHVLTTCAFLGLLGLAGVARAEFPEDPTQREIKALKAQVKALSEEQKATLEELRALTQRLERMQRALDRLAPPRSSMSINPSAIVDMGSVRLVNRLPVTTIVTLNGTGYFLEPFASRTIRNIPVGFVFYEVEAEGHDRRPTARTEVLRNETRVLTIRP